MPRLNSACFPRSIAYGPFLHTGGASDPRQTKSLLTTHVSPRKRRPEEEVVGRHFFDGNFGTQRDETDGPGRTTDRPTGRPQPALASCDKLVSVLTADCRPPDGRHPRTFGAPSAAGT